MTTLLLSFHLRQKKINPILVGLLCLVFLTIEGAFLFANLHKFSNGGWLTIVLALMFFMVMYGWYFGRKIKNQYISFVNIKKDPGIFKELSMDTSVPKIATHLVYISHDSTSSIEEIADRLYSKIQGWINYYGKFRKRILQLVFRRLTYRLMLWVRNKYKISSIKIGYNWLRNCQSVHPNLFAHWRYGFKQ